MTVAKLLKNSGYLQRKPEVLKLPVYAELLEAYDVEYRPISINKSSVKIHNRMNELSEVCLLTGGDGMAPDRDTVSLGDLINCLKNIVAKHGDLEVTIDENSINDHYGTFELDSDYQTGNGQSISMVFITTDDIASI